MRKFLFLLILLTLPYPALSGTISLTTTITTDVFTTERGEISVTLTNSGDEPAYNTQLSIISDHFSSKPVSVGVLGVNNPVTINISLESVKELKEGNYPVALVIEYTDANGYPFSSVSPITITYKNPYPSRITASIESLEIDGGRPRLLKMKIRNGDQIEREITVKIILPVELSSDTTEKKIKIGPKEEKELDFKISNFGGLSGSTYVILGVIEYEDDYHHSSFARGVVRIVEPKSFFKPSKNVVIPLVVFLVAILVLYQFLGKKVEFKIEKKGKK